MRERPRRSSLGSCRRFRRSSAGQSTAWRNVSCLNAFLRSTRWRKTIPAFRRDTHRRRRRFQSRVVAHRSEWSRCRTRRTASRPPFDSHRSRLCSPVHSACHSAHCTARRSRIAFSSVPPCSAPSLRRRSGMCYRPSRNTPSIRSLLPRSLETVTAPLHRLTVMPSLSDAPSWPADQGPRCRRCSGNVRMSLLSPPAGPFRSSVLSLSAAPVSERKEYRTCGDRCRDAGSRAPCARRGRGRTGLPAPRASCR